MSQLTQASIKVELIGEADDPTAVITAEKTTGETVVYTITNPVVIQDIAETTIRFTKIVRAAAEAGVVDSIVKTEVPA